MARSSAGRPRTRVSAHACPSCARVWALRGVRDTSGRWLITCRFCGWRDARGASVEPRSGAVDDSWVHGVQVYEQDDVLLSHLEDFLTQGWAAGGGAVVIATPEHRAGLRDRLGARGVLDTIGEGRFVELDAAATLRQFMRGGSPDPRLFADTVGSLVREHSVERPLRAYGEMVDVLWADGNVVAALRLEALWQQLQQRVDFMLLCGYRGSHVGVRGRAVLARVHDHVVV